MTAGKASLFAKHRLVPRPKRSESTNVVVGSFPKFERPETRSELSSEERALWEAAIQLGLVTVGMAEAQIAQGRTVATWMGEQKPDAEGHLKTHPRKSVDRVLLLALATLNLLVLAALAAAIVWVFRLLG